MKVTRSVLQQRALLTSSPCVSEGEWEVRQHSRRLRRFICRSEERMDRSLLSLTVASLDAEQQTEHESGSGASHHWPSLYNSGSAWFDPLAEVNGAVGTGAQRGVEMERWKGRVALVTGASVGIGAAVTRALVQHGMRVVGCARNVDKIEVSPVITVIVSVFKHRLTLALLQELKTFSLATAAYKVPVLF